MREVLKNWAGNYEYGTTRLHFPESVEQVQELVRSCNKLNVLGTRHSFNAIADSGEDLVSLDKFDEVFELDHQQNRVTVNGGMRYGQLCQYLERKGYALHNLASLPHISIVGACATGTHGSGVNNGNLATAVSALEIITGNGEVVKLSREHQKNYLQGTVVGLGALGVVTNITLDIQPTFEMRQVVYEDLPLSCLADHFEEIMSSAYSVSLFTNWQGERFHQVWLKEKILSEHSGELKGKLFEATLSSGDHHPIANLSSENCTKQMSVIGPWNTRLPHFRMEFTPSHGQEMQTEYFVSHDQAFEALVAINKLGDRIAPFLLVSEVRTIAADNLWLSPCYNRESVAIHFTWKQDWREVRKLLPVIEEALLPFNARPHWGKLFTMPPARVQACYEKLFKFKQLAQHFDPEGKFRNNFLEAYIFGKQS
jgi:xylitol oxidase